MRLGGLFAHPLLRNFQPGDFARRLGGFARFGVGKPLRRTALVELGRTSPVQLGDQVVPCAQRGIAHQEKVAVKSLDGDSITGFKRAGHLPVDDDRGPGIDLRGYDVDDGLAFDHQRLVGQRVGGERC